MKILYTFMLAVASLAFAACNNDDNNESDNPQVPEGATPTEEFTLGNLNNEPYADNAIRIESQDSENAAFKSLELFGDGHYLLLSTNSNTTYKNIRRHTVKESTTRTVTYIDGYEYGQYTKNGNIYTLANGQKIDLSTLSTNTIKYTSTTGKTSTVSVKKDKADTSIEANSLCRTWNMQKYNMWFYFNNAYIAYLTWQKENGEWYHTFKSVVGYDKDDFDDYLDRDDLLDNVVFSKNGTYLCFFNDGTVEMAKWEWVDQSKGIIHYVWPDDPESNNDVTIRFKGEQMRMYEDTYDEGSGDGIQRTHIVYTLSDN